MPKCALIAGLVISIGLVNAGTAGASFGIAGFDGETVGAEGAPYTQAGGHPAAAGTTIDFNQTTDAQGFPIPDESVRRLRIELPAGFVGNPQATPTQCSEAELTSGGELSIGLCPAASQVGTVRVDIGVSGEFTFPVYNMIPPANLPARLGFRVLPTPVHVDVRVRSGGDYGVVAELDDVGNALPLLKTTLTLWGVPADPSHDAQRGECGDPFGAGGVCPTDASPMPFLSMPTACPQAGTGILTRLHAESWLGSTDDASFFSHLPPGLPSPGAQQGPTGCDTVPFDPAISIQPTSDAADSPTGLNVDLAIPQAGMSNPVGRISASLRKAVIALPEGMSVNPSAVSGLEACSQSQVDLEGEGEAKCPPSSKVGSLELETPLLPDPLEGSVYIAKQGENPFGSLLALYVVVRGPGFEVKLPGHVEADPATGRLTASFDDNPQLPFSSLHLELFGGPRAALRNPPDCGTYSSAASLSPWSGTPPVSSTDTFAVSSGPGGSSCPTGQFDPRLDAGTANPVAGAQAPFVFRLSRDDGTQELTGVDLQLPPGLLGKPAGIPYCSDAALEAIPRDAGFGAAEVAGPSCPRASWIGTVSAGAGAGSFPFFVNTGRVYLAGPYRGAPLSIAAVVPAVAGPFDLGNVVVRSALQIDPTNAQVRAVSDPFPLILAGIPVDLRDIRVALDRADFITNPTTCDPQSVQATVFGAGGTSARTANRFQLGGCEGLGFRPKLSLRLRGGSRRGDHPGFQAILRTSPGDANIARTVVALPRSEFLEQSHIRTICTRAQFGEGACPAGAVYGHAVAYTPLLDQPLQGPVYLRSSDHALPDLVAALKGPSSQPIEVDLVGRIDSVRGGIRTTFDTVPDAPVSRFVLTMQGGRKGLLVNSRDICGHPYRAGVKMDGQNGKIADSRPVLRNSRCAG